MLLWSAALAALAAFAAPCLAEAPHSVTLGDIDRIGHISDLAFAPGGGGVAYTLKAKDDGADSRSSDLWFVPWTGEPPRQLTRTAGISERLPAFTSDGEWIFFLGAGNDEGDDTQLWRMAASGGGARQVSTITGGVSDFSLSPDGRKAVIVAPVGSRVGSKAENPPPIVVNRFHFKEDGRGYLDDRTDQLFVVDVETGRAERITSGQREHWEPSWSPDGRWIAYTARGLGEADRTLDSNIFVIAAEGGVPRRISPLGGLDDSAAWSPDSTRIVWLEGVDEKWLAYAPQQLAVANVETGAVTRPGRIDRAFYQPSWTNDGTAILSLVEGDRVVWLARVDPNSDEIDYLTQGRRVVDDYAIGPGTKLATLRADSATLPDLWAAEEGRARPLTKHNGWVAERSLGEVRDVAFASDGTEIHGYITLPPGYRGDEPLPTIMLLHGGPVYQFDYRFDMDARLYAQRGYAVVSINPRGSSGRGTDFSRAIWQDWGNLDVRDIRAAIDHVVAAGIADPDRLGVAGWSYGGVLANYMIASEPRLKAAISGAGIGNELSMYGVDMYAREYDVEWGPPWLDHNQEIWERVSYPFFEADKIRTPTMFQCGEADDNVPCVGSDQMYLALKTLGVPTVLVVYPGETHDFEVPSYIVDRARRNLEWMDRWLKPDASGTTSAAMGDQQN